MSVPWPDFYGMRPYEAMDILITGLEDRLLINRSQRNNLPLFASEASTHGLEHYSFYRIFDAAIGLLDLTIRPYLENYLLYPYYVGIERWIDNDNLPSMTKVGNQNSYYYDFQKYDYGISRAYLENKLGEEIVYVRESSKKFDAHWATQRAKILDILTKASLRFAHVQTYYYYKYSWTSESGWDKNIFNSEIKMFNIESRYGRSEIASAPVFKWCKLSDYAECKSVRMDVFGSLIYSNNGLYQTNLFGNTIQDEKRIICASDTITNDYVPEWPNEKRFETNKLVLPPPIVFDETKILGLDIDMQYAVIDFSQNLTYYGQQ